MCNCYIEAESNFLLELLAGGGKHDKPDLEMYFTVNLAFVDNLEELNESIKTPINRNWASFKQPLPVSLESFQLNSKIIACSINVERLYRPISGKQNNSYKMGQKPNTKILILH